MQLEHFHLQLLFFQRPHPVLFHLIYPTLLVRDHRKIEPGPEKRSSDALVSLFCGAINDVLEGERRKFVPSSHVELVLELHPGEEQRGTSVLPAGRTCSQLRG